MVRDIAAHNYGALPWCVTLLSYYHEMRYLSVNNTIISVAQELQKVAYTFRGCWFGRLVKICYLNI